MAMTSVIYARKMKPKLQYFKISQQTFKNSEIQKLFFAFVK